LLFAAYLIESGIVLIVTPWTQFWMRNYFAHKWPWLADAMASGTMRWIVTVIGVATLVAGVRELFSALLSKKPEEPSKPGPTFMPPGAIR